MTDLNIISAGYLVNKIFQNGISKRGGTIKLSYAFIEQGVAMLSGLLNSGRAISVNIQIMRIFARVRQFVTDNAELKRLIVILLLFFFSINSFSQSKLITKIDTAATLIAADNLDNIYLVTPKNELLKFNSSGKFLWRYSNKTLGKLTRVDATDPMRVLLYYPDFQQAVVLNNNLNEITRYRFSQDASKLITLIASANTNGYWIYDQINRELLKLTTAFAGEQQSGNIYQQTAIDLQPDILKATDQFVYLHDPEKGILEFDRFGKFSRIILVDSLTDFDINDDKISYLHKGNLKQLTIRTYESIEITIPVNNPLQVVIANKLMAVLNEKGVFLFSL